MLDINLIHTCKKGPQMLCTVQKRLSILQAGVSKFPHLINGKTIDCLYYGKFVTRKVLDVTTQYCALMEHPIFPRSIIPTLSRILTESRMLAWLQSGLWSSWRPELGCLFNRLFTLSTTKTYLPLFCNYIGLYRIALNTYFAVSLKWRRHIVIEQYVLLYTSYRIVPIRSAWASNAESVSISDRVV